MPPRNTGKGSGPKGSGAQADDLPDFLPLRDSVGRQVRLGREKSGLTLRALAARAGLSHSEISKVESGSQDCRLESFIRICTALGLPPGDVLDESVLFSSEPFVKGIKRHPLTAEIGNKDKNAGVIFAAEMATWAAFIAQLLVCSHPVKKASGIMYPDSDVDRHFLEFAFFLENLHPEKRLAILLALKEDPLQTLLEYRVMPKSFLRKFVEPQPGLLPSDSPIRKRDLELIPRNPDTRISLESGPKVIEDLTSHLTEAETFSRLSGDVKTQLPSLLKRLNRATRETGKMSALADYLKVPLASVSRWLSGKREPGGEITLQMRHWVEQQERQK